MRKLDDIELTIEDENEHGTFAISLVKSPAIQDNFIYLSETEIHFKVTNEERREVVGYALIPDKKIYRNMGGKEFNVFFSAETVRKTSELFMKSLHLNDITSEHEKDVTGVSVIESWITEDAKHDKINLYNIEPKVGGWAVRMKVYNDAEWQKVKNGEYLGFSIEANYSGLEDYLKASKEFDLIGELNKLIED